MKFSWKHSDAVNLCTSCGIHGRQDVFLEVEGVAGDLGTVRYGRCGSCGAVRPDRSFPPITTEHKLLSYYLEQGAAVDLMTAPLMQVEGARRLLEVGCGFGFALDFARVALGLEVLGVDPSRAAAAGAALLGVPVLNTGLDRNLDLGEAPFDLVLASEVIEHVDAPNSFLADLRARLTDDAVMRLTTPDADVLAETTPADDLLRALSPGHHTVLFTANALRTALAAAGFGYVRWDSIPGTLRCWASPSERGIRRVLTEPQDHSAVLLEYLRLRADTVAPASPLEVGFRYRHFKATVNAGQLDRAEDSLVALRRALLARHGVDMEQPERAVAATARLSAASSDAIDRWPFCLAGALYFLGILELNGRRRADRAETAFAAAAQIAGDLLAAEWPLAIFDGETSDLLAQSALHQVLAIAQRDLPRAVDALKALPAGSAKQVLTSRHVDIARAHLFMTAVHAQDLPVAAALRAHVIASVEQLREPSLEAAVRQALGLHATLASVAVEAPDAALPVADPVPLAGSPRITHMIDVYWCDAWGIHLKGWLHAHERRVKELRVRLGAAETVITSFHDRPDLLQFFPEHPHVVHAGFSVYVEGPAGRPVTLHITTDDGARIEMPVELPTGPLPTWPDTGSDDLDLLAEALRALPAGKRVLVLGARFRSSHAGEQHLLRDELPHLRVWGLDIHPGAGVDVVADAHQLGSVFRPGSLDAVVSGSVLEHVWAPWVIAAEINRVLRVGGLACHVAPSAWPAHAEPNDFWRFSADGLRALFGPSTGFEVLEARNMHPMAMIPGRGWRASHLAMPTVPGYASCFVMARKTHDLPDGAVSWPMDPNASSERARSYPIDGVCPRRSRADGQA